MLATLLDAPSTEPAPFTLADSGQLPSLPNVLFPDFSIPGTDAPAAEPFTVDSLSMASWAAARILEAQARTAQRSDLARSYKARIDAWLSEANASDIDSMAYLASLLKPWVEIEVAKQRRSRSILLPTATAQLRKLPDRIDIVDAPTALGYLKTNHPDAVIVREDISKSAVRSLIFTEGEAIPGVEAELGHDELYIKATA
ncbi:MAG TPA: host-nuclease inhibitor Gam family protein [bacterium]|nr:host-nuclease inhibitor Gam family protein [bacterium]